MRILRQKHSIVCMSREIKMKYPYSTTTKRIESYESVSDATGFALRFRTPS